MTRVGAPYDWPTYWDAYDLGEWEPTTHAYIDQYVTPGSTYIDIGAWIGPTVLWAAPLAGRVIAIEPDPNAYVSLAANTTHLTNVEIYPYAVGPTTGTGLISAHIQGGFGSSMSHLVGPTPSGDHDDEHGVEVSTWTLPDLFTTFHLTDVSLVKMDIEGSEALCLDSIGPWLADQGIPLLVSLHPNWYSQPLDPAWSSHFSTLEGGNGQPDQPILCIP